MYLNGYTFSNDAEVFLNKFNDSKQIKKKNNETDAR